MKERDKLPAKATARELVVHTEQSGSLVSRGLADIKKKQTAPPRAAEVDTEKLFQDAVTAWKRRDAEAAIPLAKKASWRLNGRAAELLGAIYSLSIDKTRNYVLAHMWYSVAAEDLWDTDYSWMCDDVIRSRNWVASMMTRAQVSEAEHLFKRLKATHRLALANALERAAERNPEKAAELRGRAQTMRSGAHRVMRDYLPQLPPEQSSQMSPEERRAWNTAQLLAALSLDRSEDAARKPSITHDGAGLEPDRQIVEEIDAWAQFERGEAAADADNYVEAAKWWRLAYKSI
jgi:hypothetical protein